MPNFLIKVNHEEELTFKFTIILRQGQQAGVGGGAVAPGALDTLIQGLTYVSSSTAREVESLLTREFNADPNFHKHSNAWLLGDHTTGGNPSVSFDWSWKWQPPKATDDKGGGWRNHCCVSYIDHQPGDVLMVLVCGV